MKSTLLVFLLLFSTGTFSRGRSEDRWGAYEPRTLKSIIDAHKGMKELNTLPTVDPNSNAIYISADSFPSKTQLVYLERFRPLPRKKGRLLTAWRRMLKEQAPPANVFTTELQFNEGDQEYWIAVQQSLIDEFRKDVKKGALVNGYLVLIGAVRVGERWEWLFAMNRFDS